jgi:glutathione synthase/RimK-type ligase-like ATP-grasp enzyme
VVRSNLHKRYLLDLTEECVPTVPTKLIPRGSKESLKEWLSLSGWSDVVIKPAVGAGSFDTHRLAVCDDLAQRQWQTSIDARDMLIQPYLPAVEDEGERALVWIAGEFTHAVRKTARFSADIEQVSAALPISTAERVLGESALRAALSMADDSLDSLLYARVDVARDTEGEWRVMELELIEPSLFLAQHPPALQRLIAALQYRLGITREA